MANKYTMPITRASLWFISTFVVYTVFACTGGTAVLLLLLVAFVQIIMGKFPADELFSIVLGGLALTGFLLMIGCLVTQKERYRLTVTTGNMAFLFLPV